MGHGSKVVGHREVYNNRSLEVGHGSKVVGLHREVYNNRSLIWLHVLHCL